MGGDLEVGKFGRIKGGKKRDILECALSGFVSDEG